MNLVSKIMFLVILTVVVKAQNIQGVEVYPSIEADKAQFGVTMMSEADSIFYVVMSIPGSKLANQGAIQSVSYSVFDKKSGTYLVKQTDLERHSNTIYNIGNYALTFAIDKKELVSILMKDISNLVLLLTVNQNLDSAPTHYVDFSKLCSQHPNNFINITTEKSGCN